LSITVEVELVGTRGAIAIGIEQIASLGCSEVHRRPRVVAVSCASRLTISVAVVPVDRRIQVGTISVAGSLAISVLIALVERKETVAVVVLAVAQLRCPPVGRRIGIGAVSATYPHTIGVSIRFRRVGYAVTVIV
jgi:hypothetical protein